MPTFDNLAGLTPREIEVLRLVAAGLSNQQIVDSMYLSISTVKSYLRSTFHKLGVQTRTQAVVWAFNHALVTPVLAESGRPARAVASSATPVGVSAAA